MQPTGPAINPPRGEETSINDVIRIQHSDSIAGLGMPPYGRPKCAKWVVAVCSLAFASSFGADCYWFLLNLTNTKNEAVRLKRTQHGLWMGIIAGACFCLPLAVALLLNVLGCCCACGQKIMQGNGTGVGNARCKAVANSACDMAGHSCRVILSPVQPLAAVLIPLDDQGRLDCNKFLRLSIDSFVASTIFVGFHVTAQLLV